MAIEPHLSTFSCHFGIAGDSVAPMALRAGAGWVGQGCDTNNFAVPGTDTPGIVDPHLNDPDGKIAVNQRAEHAPPAKS